MTKLKKVVFPEGGDERVQQAARQLAADGLCTPILVGVNLPSILGVEHLNPATVDVTAYPADKIAKFSQDQALIAGAAYVAQGQADAIVGGAEATTGEVAMVYKYTIGLTEDTNRFASVFRMDRGNERYIFADCAINVDPDAETLAAIANMAQQSALELGIATPRVAFLSYATGTSAGGPSVEKVTQAAAIARERWPEMLCDGPLQFDAALEPDIAARKRHDSNVAGHANVFVFPDLGSGNIAYKAVQYLGKFQAVGPLLTGFAKPAHDLSRGCSVADIVEVTKVAISQVKE